MLPERLLGLGMVGAIGVLSACLLFVDRPPRIGSDTGLSTSEFCFKDEVCGVGMVCYSNDCVPACDPSVCTQGYTCEHTSPTKTRCLDYCLDNKDCKSGFHCCSDAEWDRDACDLGDCVAN